MSLTSDLNRTQYTLASATATLTIPWKFLENSHVDVQRTRSGLDTPLVLNGDYTLSGAGNPAGGSLTLTGLSTAIGDIITINRVVPHTQLTSYEPNRFNSSTHETTLDRIVMQVAKLNEDLKRAIRLPVTNGEITALSKVTRASRLIGFDSASALELVSRQGIVDEVVAAAGAFASGTVREVGTIAALRAVPPTGMPTNFHARVLGYYDAGDGGGGTFHYDDASTDDDDGGSVIKPNAIDAADPGRWKRVETGFVSLRQFGCDPTAAVDCRNQFQRALNWCRTTGQTLGGPGDYRIASTKPIVWGRVNFDGKGVRIWNSLPDDYSWTVYGNDSYTANDVVDETGALVSWTKVQPGTMPWNGKTEMFTGAEDCVITDLYVDGGWWHTKPSTAPAALPAAKSIRGVKFSNEEETYYQVFNDNTRVTFAFPTFHNVPGAAIEVCISVKVIGGLFGEYGDHIFYTGTSYNHHISNNRFDAFRAASGAEGDRDYIFATHRQAIKLLGTTSTVITGNVVDLPSTAYFVELTSHGGAGLSGDIVNVDIIGNTIVGGIPFLFQSTRGQSTPYADGNGYVLANVRFANNVVSGSSGYFGIMEDVAVNGLIIEGNTFYASGQAHIRFRPSWEYAVPIQNMVVRNNTFQVTEGGVFRAKSALWGAGTLSFENNTVTWTGSPDAGWNLFTWDGGEFVSTSEMLSINFTGNRLNGGFGLFGIYRSLTWNGTVTSYAGFERVYADGARNRGDIVWDAVAGNYYRCRNTIAANGANVRPGLDAANWAVYARNTTQVVAMNNRIHYGGAVPILLYFLCDRLGFIPYVIERNNSLSDTGGTVRIAQLKDPACTDTVVNNDNAFLNTLTVGKDGVKLTTLRHGFATLVGGTKAIADPLLTLNTLLFYSHTNPGGTRGWLEVSSKTPGVGFTITSSNALDTSEICWLAFEP